MKYFHKLSLLKNIASIEMFAFFAYSEYLKSDSHLPKKNYFICFSDENDEKLFLFDFKSSSLSLFFVNIGKMT